ncbi:MAG: hypothetical protein ABSC22_12110 [Roseiarcus sp.]
MSLGDWLDEAVADKAAEQGVEPDDLDTDDRLDAIGERISRLSRRDDGSDENLHFGPRGESRRRPHNRVPSRDEARRADELLEAAIARLESRAERTESRAARAFESVARWIERSQTDRVEERATLQAVAEKLDAIDHRTARQQSASADAPSRLESRLERTERELEARMAALARRVEAVQDRRREAPRAPDHPRLDLQDAVSQISRRRSELDARASGAAPEAVEKPRPSPAPVEGRAPTPARAPAPTDALRDEIMALSVRLEQMRREQNEHRAQPPVDVQGLRDEIMALSVRLEQMRREQNEHRAKPPVDVQGLRAEVAAMSRSLADLAPRNAVAALEGAIRDLSDRVAAIRDNGGREALVAPLEALVGQVMDALRAHDPQAAVQGLEREIRAIDAKVDAIAQGAVNPATFERIRSQTEEVRNLLAAAAMRPVPVERLEKQIGELADRVERLASSPAPHAESARVVALLSEARAQIERATPPAALSAIEQRLEQLAQRMDQALQRPQAGSSVDPRAIEDLAQRIDAIRASVDRQSGSQPDAAKLEAALRDISQKLDRPSAAGVNTDVLTTMLQDLGARIDQRATPTIDIKPIEQALRSLGDRTVEFDTTPIENMMRDLGAKLTAPTAVDMSPLEGLLREINQKLDRDATAKVDPKFVEQAADLLAQRLERRDGQRVDADALANQISEIHDRLDALQQEGSPKSALDQHMVADLIAELDATRRTMQSLPAAEASPKSALDQHMVTDLIAELDATRRALQSQPAPDASPKSALDQHMVTDLIAELDATRRTLQSLPAPDASAKSALDQHMVADLIAELDATRRTMQSLPATAARGNDDLATGLADLRAEQSTASHRTQARLADLHDILEKLVNRLGRGEGDVARVDNSARARSPGGASIPPKVSFTDVIDPQGGAGAALREIPDRGVARPGRDGSGESPLSGKPGQAGLAAPRRSLDGADFLLEPGASLDRARSQETADPSNPKSAINAHIAAARRAAQAALAESAAKERNAKQAGVPAEKGDGAHDTGIGQAKAFIMAQRRPILLGAALVALMATFAVVELRGGHPAPMQKSELQTPAQGGANRDVPKLGALSGTEGAQAVDSSPVGSIVAAPMSAKTAPAELVAAIPTALPSSLREAAAAGDAGAQIELALRLVDGRGVAKDPHAAEQWFEQAAVRDQPFAQYRLATLYEKGIGVARDLPLAMSWYAKAANAGNARAMHNLAVINAEGAGGDKPDYAEAARWFRKAGQLGIRDSQFNLGILYARGLGVPQDLVQSWLWFSLAAQQGDADAAKKRDEVAAKMEVSALAAAAQALAGFKASTPSPTANEAPTPPGGWDAKVGAPQADSTPPAPARAGARAL